MKMRGIKLGGKKSSKILEYKLIPMITCSVKIGEELSASAITRALALPLNGQIFVSLNSISLMWC